MGHKAVRRSEIKRGFTATAHLPPDFFKCPLDQLENTIDPELAKKAVNSLLGVWSVDRHYTYTVVTQYNGYSFPFDGNVIVRDGQIATIEMGPLLEEHQRHAQQLLTGE